MTDRRRRRQIAITGGRFRQTSMIDFAGVTGFAAVSLAIALAPGPSWVYVISSTVRQGRMAGLAAVAGNATGIICHVTACLWYLSAKINGIYPDSWIVRYGFQDSTNSEVNNTKTTERINTHNRLKNIASNQANAAADFALAGVAALVRPLTGNEHGAIRNTNRRGAAAVIEPHALRCHLFHIGRFHVRRFRERQAAPAMFIAENIHNIRPASAAGRCRK